MEEQIFKLLRENRIGHAKAHYLKHEIVDLLKGTEEQIEVAKKSIFYYKDLEAITTDLLNAHVNKDMDKLKHSVMSLRVLKGI